MASPESTRIQRANSELALWEQRRWYGCFAGWHGPCTHSAWVRDDGKNMPKGSRPSTREYRKALQGQDEDANKEWQWAIVVNENTDSSGWVYARCMWFRLPEYRHGGRAVERPLDFVRRRQWVPVSASDEVMTRAKRGATKLLTPVQMREAKQAAQRKWDEGMAEVYDLLAALDSTVSIKSLATALLDPVALHWVAKEHRKAMRRQIQDALDAHPPVELPDTEVWHANRILNTVITRWEAVAGTNAPARRLGRRLKDGIHDFFEDLEQRMHGVEVRGGNQRGQRGQQAGALEHQESGGDLHTQAGMSLPPSLYGGDQPRTPVAPQPAPTFTAGKGGFGAIEKQPWSSAPPLQIPDMAAPPPSRTPSPAQAEAAASSPNFRLWARAGPAPTPTTPPPAATAPSQAAPTAPAPPSVATAASTAVPAIKPKLGRTSLGPFALDSTLGPDPPAEPEEGGVKGWMQRGSFKSPLAATRSTSLPVSRSAQRAVEAAAAAAIATEAVHDPQHKFQQHVAMLRHGSRRWAANVRAAVRGLREPRLSMDGGAEGAGNDGERGAPKKMVLSMRELEAAMGHSLGVYGDLEDYVGSTPLQSYYAAIEKFTGVPEADVLFAVWRSQAFEPAHYLAIDRARRKVVICVRGTMELVDGLTDLLGRPEQVTFGPGLCGCAHTGILRAARFIVASVRGALVEALALEPGFHVMVTGHSLGGGTAALVAMALKHDPLLPARVRQRLRAVCLAPAATVDAQLGRACQDFVVSLVYGCDMVPRAGINSVAWFVGEVARASPLKSAVSSVYKAVSKLKWGGKQVKAQAHPGAASEVEVITEEQAEQVTVAQVSVGASITATATAAITTATTTTTTTTTTAISTAETAPGDTDGPGQGVEGLDGPPGQAMQALAGPTADHPAPATAAVTTTITTTTTAATVAASVAAVTNAGVPAKVHPGQGGAGSGHSSFAEQGGKHTVAQAVMQAASVAGGVTPASSEDWQELERGTGGSGGGPGGVQQGQAVCEGLEREEGAGEEGVGNEGGGGGHAPQAPMPSQPHASSPPAHVSLVMAHDTRPKVQLEVQVEVQLPQSPQSTGGVPRAPLGEATPAPDASTKPAPTQLQTRPEVTPAPGAGQELHKAPADGCTAVEEAASGGLGGKGVGVQEAAELGLGVEAKVMNMLATDGSETGSQLDVESGGGAKGGKVEAVKPDPSLLAPLLPAGVTYWLVPKPRPPARSQLSVWRRLRGTPPSAANVRSARPQPQSPAGDREAGGGRGGGGPLNPSQTSQRSGSVVGSGGGVPAAAPPTSPTAAGAQPTSPAPPPPPPPSSPAAAAAAAPSSMGSFFQGLGHTLDQGEEMCEGDEWDRGAEGEQQGGQLVLLQVEPTTFSELLVFKRAMTDHLPLEYLNQLRLYIDQAQKDKVWTNLRKQLTHAIALTGQEPNVDGGTRARANAHP